MSSEQIQAWERAYKAFGKLASLHGGTPIKGMCEHIAKAEIRQYGDGTKPTAEQIFTQSSSGEMYHIPFWYMEAVSAIGFPDGAKLPDTFFDEIKALQDNS